MKASIILPAYNERKNIGNVIKSVRRNGDFEIIVVDDGSKDNTLEVAKRLGCNCVRLSKNIGKGYAAKIGAKLATNNSLVFMDSDGQLDASDIPKMLNALKSCRLAVGVRTNGIPPQRVISNSFATSMLSRSVGRKMNDVLCGFRAIRKCDFFSLDLVKKRYEIEAEMIIKAIKDNLKIKEVPVKVRYGIGSSMPVIDSLKVASYLVGKAFYKE